jgi:hypothetical protein
MRCPEIIEREDGFLILTTITRVAVIVTAWFVVF